MYYPFFYDSTYILVLIGVVISMIASAKLNSTYQRYSSVRSMCGLTGAEVAQKLLNNQGIYDVTVRRVAGNLTDHYDPRTKTVNLSDSVYGSTSIAAIGVAAHECGHAMQDANDYSPLRIRAALVPAANLGSQLCWPRQSGLQPGLAPDSHRPAAWGRRFHPCRHRYPVVFTGSAVPAGHSAGGI